MIDEFKKWQEQFISSGHPEPRGDHIYDLVCLTEFATKEPFTDGLEGIFIPQFSKGCEACYDGSSINGIRYDTGIFILKLLYASNDELIRDLIVTVFKRFPHVPKYLTHHEIVNFPTF